jgi:hypothetical protein
MGLLGSVQKKTISRALTWIVDRSARERAPSVKLRKLLFSVIFSFHPSHTSATKDPIVFYEQPGCLTSSVSKES